MAKRILVPIEGNTRDGEMLATARQLAHQMSAQVFLVHIAPILFDTEDVVRAEQRLDEYAKALRADGVEAHFLMGYGEPSTEIAETARQQRAELIVIAPEQRALLESLWHPRVSRGLLGHTTEPLFVLPDTGYTRAAADLLRDPDARIILALDGSENAEAALPVAIQLAQDFQRRLVLVRVVAPVFVLGSGVDAMKARHDAQYEEQAEAHRYLVETRQRVAAETSLDVETTELVGPAANQLMHLAASHSGSLLVMGTHGRTGLARLVAGSVAAEVMSRAKTPVVIVPSRAANQEP